MEPVKVKRRVIKTVEMHTGGEPLRIIVSGESKDELASCLLGNLVQERPIFIVREVCLLL